MLTSTRIILTYRALAVLFIGLSVAMAYLIWAYKPVPDTLGELLRPIGIAFMLLVGLVQAICTVADPLYRRVVRRLQHKSL
jgi:type IV secretory pathway TrbL component